MHPVRSPATTQYLVSHHMLHKASLSLPALTTTAVRANSHLRDTITQTWFYHTDVILCITSAWYSYFDIAYSFIELAFAPALFGPFKHGPWLAYRCFLWSCEAERKSREPSDHSHMKYHVCVILGEINWVVVNVGILRFSLNSPTKTFDWLKHTCNWLLIDTLAVCCHL